MPSVPKITSINIPAVGFGTGTKWFKYGNDEVDQNLVSNLKTALSKGFTHIDSAEVYNTDLEIAAAVKGVPKDSYWLTDKFFCGDSKSPAKSKWETPYLRAKAALEILDVPYIDLYLLHSPFVTKEVNGITLKEAWESMEQALDEGLVKHIGVSNFAVEHLKEVLEYAKHKPEVNQIEYNVLLQAQTPGVVEFSQEHGIIVEAYSPLGPLHRKVTDNKNADKLYSLISELSKKYGKTDTQILLRWTEQKGIVPITTTSREERMEEILSSFDFKLEDSEVEELTKIGQAYGNNRCYWNDDFPPTVVN